MRHPGPRVDLLFRRPEYLDILRDTLVLHELPAWRKSTKGKPIVSSKYDLFDVGVLGALQERRFRPGTPEFGEALETYLMHELSAYRDYVSGEPLVYWRSTSGFEVDFILGDHTAVEVKAKPNIAPGDVKSLRAQLKPVASKAPGSQHRARRRQVPPGPRRGGPARALSLRESRVAAAPARRDHCLARSRLSLGPLGRQVLIGDQRRWRKALGTTTRRAKSRVFQVMTAQSVTRAMGGSCAKTVSVSDWR